MIININVRLFGALGKDKINLEKYKFHHTGDLMIIMRSIYLIALTKICY